MAGMQRPHPNPRPPPPGSPRPNPPQPPPPPPPPPIPPAALHGTRVLELIHLGTYEIKPVANNTGAGARNFATSGSNPTNSPGVSAAVPEGKRLYQHENRRHVADQGDAAMKRPKVEDQAQHATKAQGKIRAGPLEVRGITYNEVIINGRKGAFVTISWKHASAGSELTLKTESKEVTELTIGKTQDTQNTQRPPEESNWQPTTKHACGAKLEEGN